MKRHIAIAAACVLTAAIVPCVAEAPAQHLGDLLGTLRIRHRQDWGLLGIDTACRPADGRAPMPLRLGERTYARGIGHHAGGEIVIDLAGRYLAFEALAGVQWQGGGRGSVVFRVCVDGVERFTSPTLSDSTPPVPIRLPLAGARELRLAAGDAGDGIGHDMANWVEARLLADPSQPVFGPAQVLSPGSGAPPRVVSFHGFTFAGAGAGPQASFTTEPSVCLAAVREGESIEIRLPLAAGGGAMTAVVDVDGEGGGDLEAILSLGNERTARRIKGEVSARLEITAPAVARATHLSLTTRGVSGGGALAWRGLQVLCGERAHRVDAAPAPSHDGAADPVADLPAMRPELERALIEWDWRLQDGIAAPRAPSGYREAALRTIARGSALVHSLRENGDISAAHDRSWDAMRRACEALEASGGDDAAPWETLWLEVHRLRRRIALSNPAFAACGPIAFVKQAPGVFSHQLTQYYGRYARPGGGVFVLERPGQSMRCRSLTGALPLGSFQHLDVSHDGTHVLFAFCPCDATPQDRFQGAHGRTFHLHEAALDGSGVARVTDGPFDDFAPRYLPCGQVVFISTRRGGWHRCGSPGCEVYTLHLAARDGTGLRTISYHETHEWDPAVLNDGSLIYTRWDYVDRDAVYYQQLWTARPDGALPRVFFGNNTFNPVGTWEPRALPGDKRVIATAGAHHAMTGGSIILLDVSRGIDGDAPIERLTPDALFPESETRLLPHHWHAPAGVAAPPPVPIDAQRWPGHCYRSPYPLSDACFLAAYSFDALIGEPAANPANMWGLYLVDRFGNKELLYRDLGIASLWPMPCAPRPAPPVLPESSGAAPHTVPAAEGTFYLQNVTMGLPESDHGAITALRIVQILPKSTPGINNPTVGSANASPGRQVLGTVPVEPDGSAYFRAPAGAALAFQALDRRGMAVQWMRSITYLQPGEHASCIGCHEPRALAPPAGPMPRALARAPSAIAPAPDGARPLSYPLLVQPVLDAHCVRCHGEDDAQGGVVLTGTPQGRYTASYNALVSHVPFAAWGGKSGDFRVVNSEPRTRPGFFGARASRLRALLDAGHGDVALNGEEMERLVTWMDANALFYGTFDPADQARQQRGERIAGPALE